jgi:hypothetical protein
MHLHRSGDDILAYDEMLIQKSNELMKNNKRIKSQVGCLWRRLILY